MQSVLFFLFGRWLIPSLMGRSSSSLRLTKPHAWFPAATLWLATLLLSLSSWAATPLPTTEPLQVGVLDIPPLLHIHGNGQLSGPLLEYMQALLHEAHISYQLEGFPPRRLYRNLANGTSDFWIGVKQAPDYEGKVLYGDQPIITLHLQLYWLPEVAPLQTLEQLREQKLIVIRGYSYGGRLEPLKNRDIGLNWLAVESHHRALDMLTLRRGDYLLNYAETVDEMLPQSHRINLQHTAIAELPMYLIISRQTPEAEQLMERLNQAASQLRANGEMARLLRLPPLALAHAD